MSWFTDEEAAVVAAYKSAISHPLWPQIKQKVDSAKAELALLEPILTVVEALYPPAAPIITGFEATVSTADTVVDTIDPNAQAAE